MYLYPPTWTCTNHMDGFHIRLCFNSQKCYTWANHRSFPFKVILASSWCNQETFLFEVLYLVFLDSFVCKTYQHPHGSYNVTGLSQVYAVYSEKSLFIYTTQYKHFLICREYCVANDDKTCSLPNCIYHLLLVDDKDVDDLIEILDGLCCTYQLVDCF